MARQSEIRKTMIIREAAILFREKGYMAANLRRLAKRAGIQGGSLYYHFESKQDILFTIMNHTMDDLLALADACRARGGSPPDSLRWAIQEHIKYHVENINETYVTDNELKSLDSAYLAIINDKRSAYEVFFEEILSEGVKQGLFQINDIKVITYGILQISTGTSVWFKEGGRLTADQISEIYFNLIYQGIKK